MSVRRLKCCRCCCAMLLFSRSAALGVSPMRHVPPAAPVAAPAAKQTSCLLLDLGNLLLDQFTLQMLGACREACPAGARPQMTHAGHDAT